MNRFYLSLTYATIATVALGSCAIIIDNKTMVMDLSTHKGDANVDNSRTVRSPEAARAPVASVLPATPHVANKAPASVAKEPTAPKVNQDPVNKCPQFRLPTQPPGPKISLEEASKLDKSDRDGMISLLMAHIRELNTYTIKLKADNEKAYNTYLKNCQK